MTHIHTCMLRPVEKTKSSEGCELMSDPDVSAVADYHFIWINVFVCVHVCVCSPVGPKLEQTERRLPARGVFLLAASFLGEEGGGPDTLQIIGLTARSRKGDGVYSAQ